MNREIVNRARFSIRCPMQVKRVGCYGLTFGRLRIGTRCFSGDGSASSAFGTGCVKAFDTMRRDLYSQLFESCASAAVDRLHGTSIRRRLALLLESERQDWVGLGREEQLVPVVEATRERPGSNRRQWRAAGDGPGRRMNIAKSFRGQGPA